MRVDFQEYKNNNYNINKPVFSALIIKDAKFWKPESLDVFVRNKEIQNLVTTLHKKGGNVLVAKAQIVGTLTDRIFIYLQDNLKKIAHIKSDELHNFSASKVLKELNYEEIKK